MLRTFESLLSLTRKPDGRPWFTFQNVFRIGRCFFSCPKGRLFLGCPFVSPPAPRPPTGNKRISLTGSVGPFAFSQIVHRPEAARLGDYQMARQRKYGSKTSKSTKTPKGIKGGKLKIISLGGLHEIGKNITAVERKLPLIIETITVSTYFNLNSIALGKHYTS